MCVVLAGIGQGKKCKTPKAWDQANPCAAGLYCNSKGICAKLIAEKGACQAYLPYASCGKGLYCKPKTAQTKEQTKPLPGTCVKTVPRFQDVANVDDKGNLVDIFDIPQCEAFGPLDQCSSQAVCGQIAALMTEEAQTQLGELYNAAVAVIDQISQSGPVPAPDQAAVDDAAIGAVATGAAVEFYASNVYCIDENTLNLIAQAATQAAASTGDAGKE